MRRMKPALLGSLLFCLATAAWAAVPAAPAVSTTSNAAVATPAASPDAAALPADLFAPAPQSALTITCTAPPTTVCTSCLYFGIRTSYQCTTFCVNGVPHRSCNTCGEGCDL